MLITVDTSWIPAGSRELCTTASPRTRSVLDSHCPLGSGWVIWPSRNHTAWLHSQCPTARWMAVENADKRNILHKDNNSLIFTHLQRGQDKGMKTETIQGVKRGGNSRKMWEKEGWHSNLYHQRPFCADVTADLLQLLLNVMKYKHNFRQNGWDV